MCALATDSIYAGFSNDMMSVRPNRRKEFVGLRSDKFLMQAILAYLPRSFMDERPARDGIPPVTSAARA
jgi:hypothetical protein